MFDSYIRSILPIPIVNIKFDKTGYLAKITTYSSVADEPQTRKTVEKRVRDCKRMKSIDGWYFDDDISRKYAIVEMLND